MSDGATALVVVVPEAEDLVTDVRLSHDPSAKEGMPAHITILYPFMPWAEITTATYRALHSLAAENPCFSFQLAFTDRFPGVLYLEPVPHEPFQCLTDTVCRSFPGLSPYGGTVAWPHPHLTIAQTTDPEHLDAIARAFLASHGRKLPLKACAKSLSLVAKCDGMWMPMKDFCLGDAESAG